MTLLNIISAVEERFPNADTMETEKIVNGLEQRIIDEIFSPNGIEPFNGNGDAESSADSPLLLSDDNILLYVYYVFAVFSLKEMDITAANAYSVAFNERFAELAALYRRKNMPIKKTKLCGGI